jgi:archaellum biogenesis ATPase FlaH
MTGTVATQLKAIAFDRDIERLTEGFTGRGWVFKEIDRWLQQGNERFFILTGEPGIGKSAIAAQLTQTRKDIAAYHFCIARQISTVEPNNVLLSLAAQLIKYFPDYGEALVNTVKPLFLQVKVEINIENIRDSVVQGVVIENLHIHYPKQALDILLRQALAALPNPPKEPVSILIDSLDEAVTYSNENNLVTLLSSVDDLPSWVRFILTSRPDKQRVLSYFETLKPYYYHLNELSENNKKDIHQYVNTRVLSELIQIQIQRFQVQSEALINQITELSQGNFLYTKVLLDDIELGGQPIDNLAALPKSLNELYHNFLLRLKAEWEGKYQPIFGILTVTKAPVTEEELANLLSEQLDETELGQRLRVVQQFLDVVQNDYAENTYTLFHQSLQDYLTDKEKSVVFHCSPKDGHRQIIEYCWQYHPRDWRECDRYGLRYLATHLVDMAALEKPPIKATEYIERLHKLLASEVDGRNAWFDAKDQIGETAGFLADLELAWVQADEVYDREPGKSIGLQCRYALIKTSVIKLASNISNNLLIGLVKNQVWTEHKGLSYVKQIPIPAKRFEALMILVPHLVDKSLQQEGWQEALNAASSIRDPNYSKQEYALRELFPNLSESLKQDAWKIVLQIADDYNRALTIAKIIPHLSETLRLEAFAASLKFGNRFLVFETLASHLLEPQRIKLWEETVKLGQAKNRYSQVLGFEKVLELGVIEVGIPSTQVLVATHLPQSAVSQAWQILFAASEEQQVAGLTALVPYLPKQLKQEALTFALNIQDEELRIWSLRNLAPCLEEPEQLQAWQEILRQAPVSTFAEPRKKLKLLLEIALHVPKSLQQQAWQETINAGFLELDDQLQIFDSVYLISYLPEIWKSVVLKAVLSISNHSGSKRDALFNLVPFLPETLRQQALDRALTISAKQVMTDEVQDSLNVFTARLPDFLKQKSLHIAASALGSYISSSYEHETVNKLCELAEYLPNSLKEKVLNDVLNLKHEDKQSASLQTLLPHLNKLQQQQVLETALKYRNIKEKAWLLHAVMTFLSESQQQATLPNVLKLALKLDSEVERVKLLEALIPALSESAKQEVLNAAFSIKDGGERLKLLFKLFYHLAESDKQKLLLAIQDIKDEKRRSQGLRQLMPDLSEALKQEALRIAGNIRDEVEQVECLHTLSKDLSETMRQDVLNMALKTASTINKPQVRSQILETIAHDLPASLKQQTLIAALNAALAIEDRVQQKIIMHTLTNSFASSVIQNTLKTATSAVSFFQGKGQKRSDILRELQSLMPKSMQQEALKEALVIKTNSELADFLLNPVRHLPESIRLVALKEYIDSITSNIRTDEDILIFGIVAAQFTLLPSTELHQLWVYTIKKLAIFSRQNFLISLHPFAKTIFNLGGKEALEATILAVQDVGRWWP